MTNTADIIVSRNGDALTYENEHGAVVATIHVDDAFNLYRVVLYFGPDDSTSHYQPTRAKAEAVAMRHALRFV